MEAIKSIEKAVKLLEQFTPQRSELSLLELTKMTNFPKATTHRLAFTLEQTGLLTMNKNTKKYRIGLKVLELASLSNEPLEIRQISLPYMEKLRDETNEAVHLLVEDGFEGIYIEKVESQHDIRLWTRIGAKRPMHAGAARKIIMAYYDEEKLSRYLREKGLSKITEKTITDEKMLRADLQTIKSQGYCVCENELMMDSIGLSAPIIDEAGNVIASLSIAAPSSRIKEDQIPEIVEKVVKYAKIISREMRYGKK